MRVAARPGRETWLSWLEPLSVWSAAVWGCALGIDAVISAALVYGRTHALVLAALAAAGSLTAFVIALVVVLGAVARSQRRL